MSFEDDIQVRPASIDDWQPAMDLAWRTFLRFDADDYKREGIDNFKEFVTDSKLYRNFCEGKYPLFVALIGERIVGLISLRNNNHISLLFVDGDYHRRGIGRALMEYTRQYLASEVNLNSATVFAAPYAYSFYEAEGFSKIGEETERDGMRFTPMEMFF